MTYEDAGFNQYFNRNVFDSGVIQESSLDSESSSISVSGDRIVGGSLRSTNGILLMDLEKGSFSLNFGGQERIRMGVDPKTNEVGFFMRDREGRTIMRLSDSLNYISSPDGNTIFDFDNNRIVVLDGNTPRVIIGYDKDGF